MPVMIIVVAKESAADEKGDEDERAEIAPLEDIEGVARSFQRTEFR